MASRRPAASGAGSSRKNEDKITARYMRRAGFEDPFADESTLMKEDDLFDDDLQREEQKFLEQNSRPAAQAVRVQPAPQKSASASTAKERDVVRLDLPPALPEEPKKKSLFSQRMQEKKKEEEVKEDTSKLLDAHEQRTSIIGRLVEHTGGKMVQPPVFKPTSFPMADHRSKLGVNLSKAKSKSNSQNAEESSSSASTTQQQTQVAPQRPKSVFASLASKPAPLSSTPAQQQAAQPSLEAIPASRSISKEEIDRESNKLLQQMSEEEIKEAQTELMKTFNPQMIQMLKQRAQKKNQSQEASSLGTGKESAKNAARELTLEEKIEMTQQLTSVKSEEELVKLRPKDKLEREKLKWLDPVAPEETTTVSTSVRYNFEGKVTTEEEEAKKSKYIDPSLYQHGDEPSRPGYTLGEILTLCRSSNPSQRVIFLQQLSRVLENNSITIKAEVFDVLAFALSETTNINIMKAAIQLLYTLLVTRLDLAKNEVDLPLVTGYSLGYLDTIQTVHSNKEEAEKNYVDLITPLVTKKNLLSLIASLLESQVEYLTQYSTQQSKEGIYSTNIVYIEHLLHIIYKISQHSLQCANSIIYTPNLLQLISKMMFSSIPRILEGAELLGLRIFTQLAKLSKQFTIEILRQLPDITSLCVKRMSMMMMTITSKQQRPEEESDDSDEESAEKADEMPSAYEIVTLSETVKFITVCIAYNLSETQGFCELYFDAITALLRAPFVMVDEYSPKDLRTAFLQLSKTCFQMLSIYVLSPNGTNVERYLSFVSNDCCAMITKTAEHIPGKGISTSPDVIESFSLIASILHFVAAFLNALPTTQEYLQNTMEFLKRYEKIRLFSEKSDIAIQKLLHAKCIEILQTSSKNDQSILIYAAADLLCAQFRISFNSTKILQTSFDKFVETTTDNAASALMLRAYKSFGPLNNTRDKFAARSCLLAACYYCSKCIPQKSSKVVKNLGLLCSYLALLPGDRAMLVDLFASLFHNYPKLYHFMIMNVLDTPEKRSSKQQATAPSIRVEYANDTYCLNIGSKGADFLDADWVYAFIEYEYSNQMIEVDTAILQEQLSFILDVQTLDQHRSISFIDTYIPKLIQVAQMMKIFMIRQDQRQLVFLEKEIATILNKVLDIVYNNDGTSKTDFFAGIPNKELVLDRFFTMLESFVVCYSACSFGDPIFTRYVMLFFDQQISATSSKLEFVFPARYRKRIVQELGISLLKYVGSALYKSSKVQQELMDKWINSPEASPEDIEVVNEFCRIIPQIDASEYRNEYFYKYMMIQVARYLSDVEQGMSMLQRNLLEELMERTSTDAVLVDLVNAMPASQRDIALGSFTAQMVEDGLTAKAERIKEIMKKK